MAYRQKGWLPFTQGLLLPDDKKKKKKKDISITIEWDEKGNIKQPPKSKTISPIFEGIPYQDTNPIGPKKNPWIKMNRKSNKKK